MKEQLQDLIAEGRTDQAIQELLSYAKSAGHQGLMTEVLLLSGKYETYARDVRQGTTSFEEQKLSIAKINVALLELIAKLEEGQSRPYSEYSIFSSVELIIEGEVADFNSTRRENLVGVISSILNIDQKQVRIKKVVQGSIRVIIEIPAEKVEEFLRIFYEDDLKGKILKEELHILRITKQPKAKTLKIWQKVAAVGVVIGILAGLAEVTGYSIRDLFSTSIESSNTVTILVHGANGKDQLVLPSRGIVKLIYGDAIIPEQINNEGEATFKQVPERFFQSDARVEILFQDPEGEPYRAVFHDSLYQLKKGQYIALAVKLEGLEQMSGIVKDFITGEPIEGARISIQGVEAFSNQYGEFVLEIPEEKQQQFQTIRAHHEAYKPFELSDVPIQTGREIPILMHPKQ
ncbi:MAG: carboxypeptidase regulatory-like domain-containing protein [Phaeodactylibacter sp.]|nr:carboxypeptidase regulatory-like domain-containing protein [Phaeodactylibacter sp.]